MITLTTEQAQQIEEAFVVLELTLDDGAEYGNWPVNKNCEEAKKALSTIRAAIAQEQAEQPVSQEYQDHLVNQSFDWAAMAAKHQFMEGYRIGLAEMREKCAKVAAGYDATPWKHCQTSTHAADMVSASIAAAIRAINFEGDTGFRPVSEMIAEHKQDPKKAAAIEKAKMRKEEQEPVPTGATHYQPHQKTYYKRVSATEWYLWSCTGKGWLPSKGTSDSSEWIMLSPIQAHQPAKPAEQEPVAWAHPSGGYLSARYMKEFATGLEKETYTIPLYAAPVRTKDLTDDDLEKTYDEICRNASSSERLLFRYGRAVIAADREKNK